MLTLDAQRVKVSGVNETFLTVEDAAQRLAVTPYTLREWLKAGHVRGAKIGRQWRVPESALIELAQGNNAPGTAMPTTATGAAGEIS